MAAGSGYYPTIGFGDVGGGTGTPGPVPTGLAPGPLPISPPPVLNLQELRRRRLLGQQPAGQIGFDPGPEPGMPGRPPTGEVGPYTPTPPRTGRGVPTSQGAFQPGYDFGPGTPPPTPPAAPPTEWRRTAPTVADARQTPTDVSGWPRPRVNLGPYGAGGGGTRAAVAGPTARPLTPQQTGFQGWQELPSYRTPEVWGGGLPQPTSPPADWQSRYEGSRPYAPPSGPIYFNNLSPVRGGGPGGPGGPGGGGGAPRVVRPGGPVLGRPAAGRMALDPRRRLATGIRPPPTPTVYNLRQPSGAGIGMGRGYTPQTSTSEPFEAPATATATQAQPRPPWMPSPPRMSDRDLDIQRRRAAINATQNRLDIARGQYPR